MTERTVLFMCVENACRSLMAEAIFNAQPPIGWSAQSGGTRPSSAPHARTANMLREIGLEPPPHPPRAIGPGEIEGASLRITMGCFDDASCPAHLKSLPVRDWGLPDPARLDDVGFRRVRDELRTRVEELCQEIARTDASSPFPA